MFRTMLSSKAMLIVSQTKVYFSQNRKTIEELLFSLKLLKLQEEVRLACNFRIMMGHPSYILV